MNTGQGKRPDQNESDAKILLVGIVFLFIVVMVILISDKI